MDCDADENAPLPMTPEEVREKRRRTAAELISLPAICPLRCCRRRGRCLGHRLVCLERHRGTAARRINLMMGFQVTDPANADTDDGRW